MFINVLILISVFVCIYVRVYAVDLAQVKREHLMFCAVKTSQGYETIHNKTLQSMNANKQGQPSSTVLSSGSGSGSGSISTAVNTEQMKQICSFAKLVTTYFFDNFTALENEETGKHLINI